ncbi:nuclear transport factor 2 family protein [Herbiconiux sp. P16]|uniref:nuclear transport factor 2 family protein n=1 Tax=Herbiconiux wuyangfengii TaxID=3342794 RepID=UPI0035B75AB6
MTETNRATALKFFEHLYAGDLDAALSLMTDDAVYKVFGDPTRFPLAGSYEKSQIVDLLGIIGPTVPHGVHPTITSTIADNDVVAVIGHVEAVAANGRDYANNFVFLVTLHGGAITKVDEYIDTLHANDVLFSA